MEPSSPSATLRRSLWIGLLAVLFAVVLQAWVGDQTVYPKWRFNRHLELHRAIIANQPPEGMTWDERGANGINVRVLVPFAVEGLHRVSGIGLSTIYRAVDTVFLALALDP